MNLQVVTLLIHTLFLLGVSCYGKEKSGICTTEVDVKDLLDKRFSCSFNESYNFSVKSTDSEKGIFLKFSSVILLEKDVLSLMKHVNNETTTIYTRSGPFKGKFSVYVTGNEVTVNVSVIQKDLKEERVVKGTVHTGCQENITETDRIYKFFFYEVVNRTTNCTIRISSPSKDKYYAAVTIDNVSLQGDSSLRFDGPDIDYDSKTMAGEPFEVISKQIDFTLQLDQSHKDQTFSLLLDHVNKECSGMYKIDSSVKKLELGLPQKSEDLYWSEVNCRWIIEGQKDRALGVTVSEFAVQHAQDSFVITDGASRDAYPLVQAFESDEDRLKGLVIRSSGRYLCVSLSLSEFVLDDKFSATVDVYGQGKRLFNNGSVSINANKAAYFLQVESGHQVILSEPTFSLKSGHVLVYSDFSQNIEPLEEVTAAFPKRSIVSTGNRMLLLSSGFKGSDSFTANFAAIKPGCHGVTLDVHGFYVLSGNCNASCSWLVHPPKTANRDKLLVFLGHLNFGPGGGLSLKTLDLKPLLEANYSSSAVPPIEVNALDGIYLTVNRGMCSEADANSTALSGTVTAVSGETASPDLQPHVEYRLQSPRFPSQYPLNSNRSWSFKSNGPGGFHLTFKTLDLKAGHSLTLGNGNSYFAINGSTLPRDFLVGPILKAVFQSPAAGGLQSGYGFDAVLTPIDKFQDFIGTNGSVETPSYPAPVKNNSLFFWSITVPEQSEGISAYIQFNISYNLTTAPLNVSDFLIIYDGDSIRSPRIINFTSDCLFSLTRSLLIKYQSSKSETSGVPVKISFNMETCNKADMCQNTGFCIHKDWRCNGVNDCGDNTDELNCGGVPPSPPPPPAPTTPAPSPSSHTGSGVSPASFAITVIIVLVGGIAGTLLVPVLVRRYRAYRYSRFSSVSVTE